MAEGPHIVVVDDEIEILDMLQEFLSGQGFEVSAAKNGEEMRSIVADKPAHLVILDLRMPTEDGFSLARWLRERFSVGIIMLTSSDDTVDKVVGLEIGADDYVTKPFVPRELLARIKSVLRRLSYEPVLDGSELPTVPFGRFVLNLASCQLVDSDGNEIPITGMEFDLLKTFAENPNRALSREQLLDLAGKSGSDPFDRSIDIRVSRIRQKIEAEPSKPQIIRTVHGIGYMFVL
jgi:two-component system phosphate regulon response regulator OmpR